ncbi:MAG TPA: putative sugar nucleotidyl transferase [Gemmatimonadales bacterium]|jgi:UDP-N-acetylglucosamine diphosphorylase/glucosamine-1-phosphate N-acetyltransferase
MPVYLYDDPADVPRFLPFTESRPIGELRHGAWLLRERVEQVCGAVAGHLAAPHLADFSDPGAPPVVSAPEARSSLILRSTFVPGQERPDLTSLADAPGVRLTDSAGEVIGAQVRSGADWKGPKNIPASWPALVLPGKRLTGVWEIVADLLETLRADVNAVLDDHEGGRIPAGCTVLGPPESLLVADGALVEPMVVFDTRNGPIWIQEGAEIRTFVRLAGPLVIGRGTRIVGGQLREASIGPRCVVHGEVSNSIFLGYSNKAHDGFLGHTIVGRWANLGAGTINSNLKNTYGSVRLQLGGQRIDTGMQFLGALVGDHVKTAIGTMLPTGCVIGTGANIFGSKRPESAVKPFAWGTDEAGKVVDCQIFAQTAAKVLSRRNVEFDDRMKRYLASIWAHCTGKPCA